MQTYQINLNRHGNYIISCNDYESGFKTIYQNTQTKDCEKALCMALEWSSQRILRKRNRKYPSENVIQLSRQIENLSYDDSTALLKILKQKIKAYSDKEKSYKTEVYKNQKKLLEHSSLLPQQFAKKCYEPANPECTIKLCEFLKKFWDPQISDYIRNKLAHNKSCGEYHCREMRSIVDRYWLPYFGRDFTIGQLSEQYLEDFLQNLAENYNLKGATINHARSCASAALKWLKNKGIIKLNPMANIEQYSKRDSLMRGIPSESEIKKLYELKWDSEVMYLAFNLSAFSGLRPGEISGLQICDIDPERNLLTIRHSWHRTGFLKETKTKLVRKVPVAHDIIQRLLIQAKKCPLAGENSFVFWSNVLIDKPYLPQYYDKGFFEALRRIGISEEERRERNINFYSLRHFCATYLANTTDMRNVQAVLGHTNPLMSAHYANHMTEEHFDQIRQIFEEGRRSIINK